MQAESLYLRLHKREAKYGEHGIVKSLIPMTIVLYVSLEMCFAHGRGHRQRSLRFNPGRIRLSCLTFFLMAVVLRSA